MFHLNLKLKYKYFVILVLLFLARKEDKQLAMVDLHQDLNLIKFDLPIPR